MQCLAKCDPNDCTQQKAQEAYDNSLMLTASMTSRGSTCFAGFSLDPRPHLSLKTCNQARLNP